jgi:hypothetical protein
MLNHYLFLYVNRTGKKKKGKKEEREKKKEERGKERKKGGKENGKREVKRLQRAQRDGGEVVIPIGTILLSGNAVKSSRPSFGTCENCSFKKPVSAESGRRALEVHGPARRPLPPS